MSMILIEIADNGASVETANCFDANTKQVFEYEDGDNIGGAMEMLWYLIDALGLNRDSYSRTQIEVSVKHGRKYDCTDKHCKICKGAECIK